MESVRYILGKSDYIQGVGKIYPIIVSDYDEFSDCSSVLNITKQHFPEDAAHFHLLDLIIYGFKDDEMVSQFEKLFSMVLRKEVKFISNEKTYAFVIDDEQWITGEHYDLLRTIVMKQNLVFEQKVYKNPLVAEWAKKAMAAKSKGGVKITIEDMISSISVVTGKSYEQIGKQTLYQLNADFRRIIKDKDYHIGISMRCAGAEKVNVNYFAEEINLFQNPYDDLFVSRDKLNDLDRAMGN